MSEAMYKIKDLSEDEFIFITAFMKEIKNLISKISAMTQEERLAWYEKFQYPRPINFQKKIEWLKQNKLWHDVEQRYLYKKNTNTNPDKKSRSLRAEAINEICNENGYNE